MGCEEGTHGEKRVVVEMGDWSHMGVLTERVTDALLTLLGRQHPTLAQASMCTTLLFCPTQNKRNWISC